MSRCAWNSVLQKFPEIAGIAKVTQVHFIEMREREGSDVLGAREDRGK